MSRARRALLAEQTASVLADTFKVLGDVTRVRILDALSREDLCVGDLASLVGQSESAVSHQLRLLRSARLVRARRAGRLVFYALDDEHIIELFEQGLRHVEEAAGAASRLLHSPLVSRRHTTEAESDRRSRIGSSQTGVAR